MANNLSAAIAGQAIRDGLSISQKADKQTFQVPHQVISHCSRPISRLPTLFSRSISQATSRLSEHTVLEIQCIRNV